MKSSIRRFVVTTNTVLMWNKMKAFKQMLSGNSFVHFRDKICRMFHVANICTLIVYQNLDCGRWVSRVSRVSLNNVGMKIFRVRLINEDSFSKKYHHQRNVFRVKWNQYKIHPHMHAGKLYTYCERWKMHGENVRTAWYV